MSKISIKSDYPIPKGIKGSELNPGSVYKLGDYNKLYYCYEDKDRNIKKLIKLGDSVNINIAFDSYYEFIEVDLNVTVSLSKEVL